MTDNWTTMDNFQVVVLRHDVLTTQGLLALCNKQLSSLDSSSVPSEKETRQDVGCHLGPML
jgi:hypothetical protein